MPNTDPAQDNASVVEYVWRRGREVGLVDVFPIGAITSGGPGPSSRRCARCTRPSAGVRLFSDDGDPVPTASMMRRAFEYAKTFDGVIVEHAEDPSLRDGHMHEGEVSALLGTARDPGGGRGDLCPARRRDGASHRRPAARRAPVDRRRGSTAVRSAKAQGIRVTCEVTPHHIALTDDAVRTFDAELQGRATAAIRRSTSMR